MIKYSEFQTQPNFNNFLYPLLLHFFFFFFIQIWTHFFYNNINAKYYTHTQFSMAYSSWEEFQGLQASLGHLQSSSSKHDGPEPPHLPGPILPWPPSWLCTFHLHIQYMHFLTQSSLSYIIYINHGNTQGSFWGMLENVKKNIKIYEAN